MQMVDLKKMSHEEVEAEFTPFLEKVLTTIPHSAKAKIDTNDEDGVHIIFEATDYFYKILGSEYHPHTDLCYLNIVRATESWKTCYESIKIEQEEVDASIGLEAGFLEHYEWVLCVIEQIIAGELG